MINVCHLYKDFYNSKNKLKKYNNKKNARNFKTKKFFCSSQKIILECFFFLLGFIFVGTREILLFNIWPSSVSDAKN